MNTRRLTALMAGIACIVGAFAAGCNNNPEETASPDAGAAPGGTMSSPGAGASPAGGAMGGAPSTPGVSGAAPSNPPGPK